jgi:DNA polymerase-3 subunit beta
MKATDEPVGPFRDGKKGCLMKFLCEKDDLNYSLNIALKGVSARTTLPILKGIKISCVAGENKVSFFSSDLDISIETSAPAFVEAGGEIVVSAKLFSDIVREMPSGQITFELRDGDKTFLSCGNSEFDIQGISPEQFPVMDREVEGRSFNIGKSLLKEMIRMTAFSASLEEARGIITGVLFEMDADGFSMVALDGFRMAIAREKIGGSAEGKMIIPSRIINEIGKILTDTEGGGTDSTEIVAGENKARFIVDETTIITRLMEGEFIKYNDILPKESKITIKIDKRELEESVKRSSIIVREGKNAFIKFKIDGDELIVSSRADEGRNKDVVEIEKEGEDIEIGFNGRFINDVLRVVPDEKIVMEFSTSISPCIIKPAEGDQYEYLILPVRLSTVSV